MEHVPMVYVVQENPHNDYGDIRRYGLPDFLYQRDVFPDNVEERTRTMREIAEAKLKDFRPETDFLVASGDPAGIAIAVSYLAKTVSHFTLLKWDREGKRYYPVPIP